MRIIALMVKAPAAKADDLSSVPRFQHAWDELAYSLLCSDLNCLSLLIFLKTSLLECFSFTLGIAQV